MATLQDLIKEVIATQKLQGAQIQQLIDSSGTSVSIKTELDMILSVDENTQKTVKEIQQVVGPPSDEIISATMIEKADT